MDERATIGQVRTLKITISPSILPCLGSIFSITSYILRSSERATNQKNRSFHGSPGAGNGSRIQVALRVQSGRGSLARCGQATSYLLFPSSIEDHYKRADLTQFNHRFFHPIHHSLCYYWLQRDSFSLQLISLRQRAGEAGFRLH